LQVYGLVNAATELLQRTPQKWMSNGNLTLLKTLGVSDKPDQLYRLATIPDKRTMEAMNEERLDVLLMFLDRFQEEVKNSYFNLVDV
jgi:hypothetical protein